MPGIYTEVVIPQEICMYSKDWVTCSVIYTCIQANIGLLLKLKTRGSNMMAVDTDCTYEKNGCCSWTCNCMERIQHSEKTRVDIWDWKSIVCVENQKGKNDERCRRQKTDNQMRETRKKNCMYNRFHTKQSLEARDPFVWVLKYSSVEKQCGRESQARQGEWIPGSWLM